MSFQIITPKMHGVLDYTAAVGLIALPFILNLGETSAIAHWLSVFVGLAVIGTSLLTDYQFSLVKLFSFRTHLIIDLMVAALFLAVPFVFNFSGIAAWYYFVMGAGVIVIVTLSNPSSNQVAISG